MLDLADGGQLELPTFKVILLGASSVGKTSIITSFKEKTFGPANPEMNNKVKELDVLVDVMDADTGAHYNVNMRVWDPAGQEVFDSVTMSYYRKSDAAILVYAVDNRVSFDACYKWNK